MRQNPCATLSISAILLIDILVWLEYSHVEIISSFLLQPHCKSHIRSRRIFTLLQQNFLALKYAENRVVWGYSYIFLLYNPSKWVPISAECLLQLLCPSVRPSIHSSFHLYAWNNSGIQYVSSWHLIPKSCKEKHRTLSLFDSNVENMTVTSYETRMPLCSHLQRHKYSYHPTRKRKKLLLFFTALRWLFFILIHWFNKWRI